MNHEIRSPQLHKSLFMLKDVKRSLTTWPLIASVLLISICWIAGQSDPLSRLVASKLGQTWTSFGGPVFWDDALLVSTQGGSPARSEALPSKGAIDEIAEWDDTPLEIVGYGKSETGVIGIPTPELGLGADLFGFPIADWPIGTTAASTAEGTAEGTAATTSSTQEVAGQAANDDAFMKFIDSISMDPLPSLEKPASQPKPESLAIANEPNKESMVAEKTLSISEPVTDPVDTTPVLQLNAVMLNLDENPTQAPAATQAINDIAPPTEIPFADELPKATIAIAEPGVAKTQQMPTPSPESRSEKLADVAANSSLSRLLAEPRSATWPVSNRLLEQLDALVAQPIKSSEGSFVSASTNDLGSSVASNAEDLEKWSTEVRTILLELPESNRLGDSETGLLLDRLAEHQSQAIETAETLRVDEKRVAWLIAAHAIERRLAVWRPIHEINSGQNPSPQRVTDQQISVSDAIAAVRIALEDTGDPAGWRRFLLVDELEAAQRSSDDKGRSETAQKYLARLNWPSLDRTHREWLQSAAIQDLSTAIRPWASSAIDYAALLHQIERAESNAIDLVTSEIAKSMQGLQHATHPKAKELAKNLDLYYRNANVRVAIDQKMIKRLLPEVPARAIPVRTTMLGSRVNGMSHIDSQLGIQLTPSTNSWQVTLQTLGAVSTRSVGRSGPAAISTSSQNHFTATTPIVIDSEDIRLQPSAVDVQGGSRLRGVNTKYDGWPLFGQLVANFAESEYWKRASLSNRIANGRIRTQIGEEVDRSVNDKIHSATKRFSDSVLGPLNSLQLQPKVVDLQTTQSRLIARYRMAGDWQLAAMTPRPRAPADSLLSVQLHQSAINNTLEQLVVQEEASPLPEMLTQCYELLGMESRELPEDLPEDVEIQFARHRPITVEIADGKAWVTMRVIRLQRGKRLKLRNFIVRASYVPVIEGLRATLVREGHLSISGPGMSMRHRLPVRAIFNKVLSPNRDIPLTVPTLLADRVPAEAGVSQFELRDGWVGVAIGPLRTAGDRSGDIIAGRETLTR